MPFTFSHPAIVLPLRLLPKRWVSLTGLIVGSVVPDFEKFMKMEGGNIISHSLVGLAVFNLPLGLLLCLLFHGLVRDSLIDHLPLFLRARLNRYKKFNWIACLKKKYPVVMASILAGAFSHIVWDSITHKGGRLSSMVPVLYEEVLVNGRHYPYYALLDLLSTVAGLAVVVGTVLALPKEKLVQSRHGSGWRYWLNVVSTALLILMLRHIPEQGLLAWWDLVFAAISATLIGLVVSSCIAKLTTSPLTS